MPYSSEENRKWVKDLLNNIKPNNVLDIGAGSGTYGKICKDLGIVDVDCVEVWEPYVTEFSLKKIYNNVFIDDVRKFNNFNYDLIIFGDVLEHMSEEDALNVYKKALEGAKYVMFSMPIIHYPQGCEHGNPYEEHIVDDWSNEKILDFFPNIVEHKKFDITGTYLGKKSI